MGNGLTASMQITSEEQLDRLTELKDPETPYNVDLGAFSVHGKTTVYFRPKDRGKITAAVGDDYARKQK